MNCGTTPNTSTPPTANAMSEQAPNTAIGKGKEKEKEKAQNPFLRQAHPIAPPLFYLYPKQ
jgi:hypothetical protein